MDTFPEPLPKKGSEKGLGVLIDLILVGLLILFPLLFFLLVALALGWERNFRAFFPPFCS